MTRKRVWQFIAATIRSGDVAPTVMETAKALGLKFYEARNALVELDRLGYIRRKWQGHRAISVLKWPDEAKLAA